MAWLVMPPRRKRRWEDHGDGRVCDLSRLSPLDPDGRFGIIVMPTLGLLLGVMSLRLGSRLLPP